MVYTYVPKAAGQEKSALYVTKPSPHSDSRPGKMAGPSNLPFGLVLENYMMIKIEHMHNNFHLPCSWEHLKCQKVLLKVWPLLTAELPQ